MLQHNIIQLGFRAQKEVGIKSINIKHYIKSLIMFPFTFLAVFILNF
jgi:hypothetical protein